MNVLYLTYDGLLDPLGDSQILPYIEGVRPEVENFYIISFEKPSKTLDEIQSKRSYLLERKIVWIQLQFSDSSNILLKALDMMKLYIAMSRLMLFIKIDLIHARGHPSASAALLLKRIFNFKLLFDFRGLWADEKVTKGSWNLSKTSHLLQYNYYKQREIKLFKNCEKLVVLTKKVALEIESLLPGSSHKITIIPCAADYEHFNLRQNEDRRSKSFGRSASNITLGYLGSIGPMYQFERYLRFIDFARQQGLNCSGLVISGNLDQATKEIQRYFSSTDIPNFLTVASASRATVPHFIHQMSCLISFYEIKYSVISVSPTKIGETLACGIPVICNAGIGDTNEIITSMNAGFVMDDTSDASIQKAVSALPQIMRLKAIKIRESSKKIFDLDIAVNKYIKIYHALQSTTS